MVVVGGAARRRARRACVALLRDRPTDLGLAPYGGEAEPAAGGPAPPAAIAVLREVGRDRVFLALAGSFFICGATTVGLIAVHLIPAAHDHGIPAGPGRRADGGDGRPRHRGHDGLGLADRPLRRAQAAARLLRRARDLAAHPAHGAGVAGLDPHGLHRLLRPGLDRHRAADGRARHPALRAPRSASSRSAGSSPPTRSAARPRPGPPASCATAPAPTTACSSPRACCASRPRSCCSARACARGRR